MGANALGARRDGMAVEGAMADGVVANWDVAEALLEHSFKNCLACDSAEHPLLMAEPSFVPAADREKVCDAPVARAAANTHLEKAYLLCAGARLI